MKYSRLLLAAILLASVLCFSTGQEHGNAMAATSATASFSATIDGIPVTGNGVDDLQIRNSAFVMPGPRGDKTLLFYLVSSKNGDDNNPNYSLRFSFPDKTGVSTKTSRNDDTCKCDLTIDLNVAKGGNLARYWADAITVNITSMTATRLAGSFSGKFVLSSDTPRAEKKEITVTNGKFDIPFSTSKITPP